MTRTEQTGNGIWRYVCDKPGCKFARGYGFTSKASADEDRRLHDAWHREQGT